MIASVRCSWALVVLLVALGPCLAADKPLARVEISKIGKASTALVEMKARWSYGSAFCIHPSGLFLTNEHVAQGEVTLVLNPGLKTEKACRAQVVRSDKELDLALLRVEGLKDLPALPLGSDEGLAELQEVVTVGFPFGTALSPDRKRYPAVSINVGSITSLRRKGGNLHRIQLDAALNPGNSGGPVLDKNGKVIGVVVAGVRGSGVNFAIPVSVVKGFVARPEVQFDPPPLSPANISKPVVFEAEVAEVLPSAAALTVDLILKPAGGRERTYRMEASKGKYRVAAVPMPPAPGVARQRLLARFDNGVLNATVADQPLKVGDHKLKLSEVRSLRLKPKPHVVLHDGTTVEGAVTGLDAVPVLLGGQSLSVNLTRAAEVKFAPAAADLVWYTLVVQKGGKEVFRQSEGLAVQGLLPAPATGPGESDIRPPTLEGDKVVRKLASPVADVAVGGGGRYLVLHLPRARKLAVFDVNAAKVVGHIPMNEEGAKFAAGLEDVVIVLPRAGTIERWGLKTLERKVAATLPVKGVIKAVAMGAASKGPLLVHSAVGTQPLDRASFALVNVETMRLLEGEIKTHPFMGTRYRDALHIRASANGKVFGLWCTSHSPSGLGAIILSDTGVEAHYAHTSVGHVLPGPDGKALFTRSGKYAPRVKLVGAEPLERGGPMVPACHGNYYLSLPPAGKKGAPSVHAPGSSRPIATLKDLDVSVPAVESVTHDFTFDKRVHLVPEAKLVITIPVTNDRLLLHRLGG
jgi:hypothetical protein